MKLSQKLLLALFILMAIAIGIFSFLYFDEKSNRESAESRYLKEKKEYQKTIRDSLVNNNDTIINRFVKENDSLKKLKNEIIYVAYEKYLYADRDLDSALRVISSYRYHSKSKETD
jgi:hypothetical protein